MQLVEREHGECLRLLFLKTTHLFGSRHIREACDYIYICQCALKGCRTDSHGHLAISGFCQAQVLYTRPVSLVRHRLNTFLNGLSALYSFVEHHRDPAEPLLRPSQPH